MDGVQQDPIGSVTADLQAAGNRFRTLAEDERSVVADGVGEAELDRLSGSSVEAAVVRDGVAPGALARCRRHGAGGFAPGRQGSHAAPQSATPPLPSQAALRRA
jgi:hypothetical protein